MSDSRDQSNRSPHQPVTLRHLTEQVIPAEAYVWARLNEKSLNEVRQIVREEIAAALKDRS